MRVVIYYGDGEGANADKLYAKLRDDADWCEPQTFSVSTEHDPKES